MAQYRVIRSFRLLLPGREPVRRDDDAPVGFPVRRQDVLCEQEKRSLSVTVVARFVLRRFALDIVGRRQFPGGELVKVRQAVNMAIKARKLT